MVAEPVGPVVRVVMVDDHPLFVRGMVLLLPQVSGGRVQVVATTGDASQAGAMARRHLPDVVLVDLVMPEPGGLRAVAAVRRTEPGCRVVALSGTDDHDLATAALEAGAEAFLPKTAAPEDLVTPLLAVCTGWSVLSADLLRAIVQARRDDGPLRGLGGEDRHLLRRLAQGRGTADIAAEIHVSERTAKRMVATLLRRLGVATRSEAAALAGRSGMLDAPSS
jgi:two-component system, NarL family, nitrate/nitrite response regulator NarL